MRINDHIFFAPDFLLKNMNLSNKDILLTAFKSRVQNYYIEPITILNRIKSAFSATILEFSMIDALARYSTNNNYVGDRIKDMLINNFKVSAEIANKAYLEFRNGLLHENHIKNCGQLCYETSSSFELKKGCLIINPFLLQKDLENYFEKYSNLLAVDNSFYETFLLNIKNDFQNEIEFFRKLD